MSRMNFHGPKDVRAIEVLLYVQIFGVNTVLLLLYEYLHSDPESESGKHNSIWKKTKGATKG